jgi:predicted dehydrogenase
VARLPDGVLKAGAAALARFAETAGAPAEARTALGDLDDLVRNEPRGLEALKRILLETRQEQLRAIVEGILKHHVGWFDPVAGTPPESGVSAAVAYRAWAWPPVRALAALVAEGTLGEVASIRVQAVLGGRGGRLPAVPPDPDGWPCHDAFDHLPLLAILGGPIATVAAYADPMDPVRGGRALVAVGFEAPGRYGLLECVWAPDMTVASEGRPHDLQAEVAGTDGVAWLRRGEGRRAMQAPIQVRVGKEWRTYGVANGLEDAWDARDPRGGAPDARALRSASAARELLIEASRRRETIPVGPVLQNRP